MKTVAVLGGGVGGLTAAHELVERGFVVDVYERDPVSFGGKARSVRVVGTGRDGRRDLPGEHGFRFFPGFYRHLPDTMKRIPFAANPNGVFDNLVPATHMQLARKGKSELYLPLALPTTIRQGREWLGAVLQLKDVELTPADLAFFSLRMMTLLTSCDERRRAQWERVPWWEFIDAPNRSADYARLLARGLTRTLVAMKAEEASTRTVGTILMQLTHDATLRFRDCDRLLSGPTSDVWIEPWLSYLRRRGVRLHSGVVVNELTLGGGRIVHAGATVGGKPREIVADAFVCALPVEVTAQLVTPELAAAAPSLAKLRELKTEWMSGIQFYLDRDPAVGRGHTIYTDSSWALTSISQRQFWPNVDLSQFGDGRVRGILSVDISDWELPGTETTAKPARSCTAEEVARETWAQIVAHLSEDGVDELEGAEVLGWSLDPSLTFGPTGVENAEPLLVNTAGSLQYRPEPVTEIQNLFLASDYVRTHTDLATMEAANEAARRAVNGILQRASSRAPLCALYPLEEPAILAPAKALDWARFKMGQPHLLETAMDLARGISRRVRANGPRVAVVADALGSAGATGAELPVASPHDRDERFERERPIRADSL